MFVQLKKWDSFYFLIKDSNESDNPLTYECFRPRK